MTPLDVQKNNDIKHIYFVVETKVQLWLYGNCVKKKTINITTSTFFSKKLIIYNAHFWRIIRFLTQNWQFKEKYKNPNIPKINCFGKYACYGAAILFIPTYFVQKKASAKSKIVFYLLRSYRWSLNLVYCKWRDAERPCVFCRHWAWGKSSAALRTSFLGWLGTAFNLLVRIRSQTL